MFGNGVFRSFPGVRRSWCGRLRTLSALAGLLLSVMLIGCANAGNDSTPPQPPTPSNSGYTLNVTRSGDGQGTVTTSDGKINCGSTCSANYPAGTTVTLSLQPANGSMSAGMSGVSCINTTCTLTLSAATSVTASFKHVGIAGTKILTYVNSAGQTVDVPQDLTKEVINALVPQTCSPTTSYASCDYNLYPGDGHADGTFVIPGIAAGTMYLLQETIHPNTPQAYTFFTWTDEQKPQLGGYVGGTNTAVYPQRAPTVNISITGYSHATASPGYWLYAPELNYLQSYTAASSPAGSLTGSAGWQGPLAAQDQIWLLPNDPATPVGTASVVTQKNLFGPQIVTMTDGGTATLSGAMQSVPQSQSVHVSAKTSVFSNQLGPLLLVGSSSTTVGTPTFSLTITSHPDKYGTIPAPTVVNYANPSVPTTDLDVPLTYGNGLPGTWLLQYTACVWRPISWTPCGSPTSLSDAAYVCTNSTTAPSSTTPLAPEFGAMTRTSTDLFGINMADMKRVSFVAPASGSVSYYRAVVYLIQDGQGKSPSAPQPIAEFRSTVPAQFKIPLGVWSPSSTYYVANEVILEHPPADGNGHAIVTDIASSVRRPALNSTVARSIDGWFTSAPAPANQNCSWTRVPELIPMVLSIAKTGAGSGTVTSKDGLINCGATCSATYNFNMAMPTLTATPASGSTFAGWSGGGCSGTGSCLLTGMSSAGTIVTANFSSTGTTSTGPTDPSGTTSTCLSGHTCLLPQWNQCLSTFYDPNLFNWYAIQNNCSLDLEVDMVPMIPGYGGGTVTIRAGQHYTTGDSKSDVQAANGFQFYVCPAGYMSVDANNQYVTKINTPYKCESQ